MFGGQPAVGWFRMTSSGITGLSPSGVFRLAKDSYLWCSDILETAKVPMTCEAYIQNWHNITCCLFVLPATATPQASQSGRRLQSHRAKGVDTSHWQSHTTVELAGYFSFSIQTLSYWLWIPGARHRVWHIVGVLKVWWLNEELGCGAIPGMLGR
jgi:hypothetical protein